VDKRDLWQNIQRRLDSSPLPWRERITGFGQMAARDRRTAGGTWTDQEVFKALVLAVLSSNTDWSKVEGLLPELPTLFHRFDPAFYATLSDTQVEAEFVPWFAAHRAGSMTLKRNLIYLIQAARKLERHSRAHGSADSYFTAIVHRSQGDPKRAALLLGSDPAYKLPSIGVPLAAETLRNLGYDVAKPDRHIMRAVGCFGLVDFGVWSADETLRGGTKAPNPSRARQVAAMSAVEDLAHNAQEQVILVDTAIWLLCAKSGLNLCNADLTQLAGTTTDVLVALIESWMQEDPTEQRETFDHLVRGLNENRRGGRELFPEALKGTTW